MTILGPLFSLPLHVQEWRRPILGSSRKDYRVTNPYTGVDLVNGGLHKATDVGNADTGYPVIAPIDCKALSLKHFDGALGVRFIVGDQLALDLWHLSKVDVPDGAIIAVPARQIVGLTGNTGALVDGKPMPAHTHIELWDHGQRVDAQPYLEMVESPAQPLPENSMNVAGADFQHISNRSCRLTVKANFREAPSGSAPIIDQLEQGALFLPVASVTGEKVGNAADAARWYYGIKTAGVEGNQMGCIHSSALPRTKDGKGVQLDRIETGFTAEDMAASKLAGRGEMKREAQLAVAKLSP